MVPTRVKTDIAWWREPTRDQWLAWGAGWAGVCRSGALARAHERHPAGLVEPGLPAGSTQSDSRSVTNHYLLIVTTC
jgi:hypothetical protein